MGYFLLKQPGHTGSIFGSADADGNDAQTSSPPSYENILPARNIRCSSKVKFHKKNRDFFGFKEQNKKNIILHNIDVYENSFLKECFGSLYETYEEFRYFGNRYLMMFMNCREAESHLAMA